MKKILLFMLIMVLVLCLVAMMSTVAFASDGGISGGAATVENDVGDVVSAPGSVFDWGNILNPVLIASALSFVALIFDIIRKIVPVIFNWLKTKATNAKILGAIEEAEKEAETIVLSLQQTVVEGLKAKAADGKLSLDDIKDLEATSVKMFFEKVSDSTVKVLTEKSADINGYVSDLIQRKIQEKLKLPKIAI